MSHSDQKSANRIVVRLIAGREDDVFNPDIGGIDTVSYYEVVESDLDPEIVFHYHNQGPGSAHLPDLEPVQACKIERFDDLELEVLRRHGVEVVVQHD